MKEFFLKRDLKNGGIEGSETKTLKMLKIQ